MVSSLRFLLKSMQRTLSFFLIALIFFKVQRNREKSGRRKQLQSAVPSQQPRALRLAPVQRQRCRTNGSGVLSSQPGPGSPGLHLRAEQPPQQATSCLLPAWELQVFQPQPPLP